MFLFVLVSTRAAIIISESQKLRRKRLTSDGGRADQSSLRSLAVKILPAEGHTSGGFSEDQHKRMRTGGKYLSVLLPVGIRHSVEQKQSYKLKRLPYVLCVKYDDDSIFLTTYVCFFFFRPPLLYYLFAGQIPTHTATTTAPFSLEWNTRVRRVAFSPLPHNNLPLLFLQKETTHNNHSE